MPLLPKPLFVDAWTEPESAANTDYQPQYPYNNVTQTAGGHSFELDDTLPVTETFPVTAKVLFAE